MSGTPEQVVRPDASPFQTASRAALLRPNKVGSELISVCIPTFRRNQMLEQLLRNLALQETAGLFEVSVVVVDNDAAGGARETVSQLVIELGLDITYAVGANNTIPAARNHALRLARGNYIGIIDDDEFPPPHWLLSLYRGIQTFDVHGALGPVIPFFEQTPPAWLVKSGLCELPNPRTGTLLAWSQTRTGNVLLKREVFEKNGIRFDESFKTGGSDQAFFRSAMRLGCRFVAVSEAPVYEVVPAVRWTRTYWLKRSLVNGFNAQQYIASEKRRAATIKATVKSGAAVFIYVLTIPVCACLGTHALMNCLQKGCWHLSRLCAALGMELWKKRDF